MKEIALKEKDIEKLKKYPLERIMSTESVIYYYKNNQKEKSVLLKKLFRTEQESVERKEKTISDMQNSELSTYKELVIPKEIVLVQGIKSGFTIEEVTDSINLHFILKDQTVPTIKKIHILQKIGDLLKRTQSQEQSFFFGDLQDYNFLVDKEDNIYAVDLDSAATEENVPLETKYIAIDRKTHKVEKYKVTKETKAYPSKDVENFCYNTMVLNFLADTATHRLSYGDYYNYIEYLEEIGYPKEMMDIYRNHYIDKQNKMVVDMLEDLPKDLEEGNYKVYQNKRL